MNVLPITTVEAKPWIMQKHYAHRMPSVSWAFGMFDDGCLIGICTYGTPASSTLLRGVCGKRWKEYVCELNRLCLKYNRPNEASMLVSRSMKLLPKPKIVISYADSGQGHIGYVYQACNFIYTGLSSKFRDPRVKGLESQHHATYAHGMSNAELREKYGERLYYIERDRKHRYVYFAGNKRDVNKMKQDLQYPDLPYPKGETKRYDAGAVLSTQPLLFNPNDTTNRTSQGE